jgi:uncharacterized protein YndB with AHSA1/START domain
MATERLPQVRERADTSMDEIRRRVMLRAPIDAVWAAVATSDGLSAWLGCSELDVDALVGSPVVVRWPDGTVSRGLVEDVQPPFRFAFRWRRIAGTGLNLRAGEPTLVVVQLAPAGDHTTSVTVIESAGVLSVTAPGDLPGESS